MWLAYRGRVIYAVMYMMLVCLFVYVCLFFFFFFFLSLLAPVSPNKALENCTNKGTTLTMLSWIEAYKAVSSLFNIESHNRFKQVTWIQFATGKLAFQGLIAASVFAERFVDNILG